MTGVKVHRRADGSFSVDDVLCAYDQACGVTPAPQQSPQPGTKKEKWRPIARSVDDKKTLRAWPSAAVEAEFDAWNTRNQEFAEFLVDFNEWQHPQYGDGYLSGSELEALVKPIRDDHPQFRRLPFETAKRTAWITYLKFAQYTKSQGDDETALTWYKPYSFHLRPPSIITNPYDVERDPAEIRFRLKAGIELRCTAHPALVDVLLYAASIKGVRLRRNAEGEWYLVPSFQRGGKPNYLADDATDFEADYLHGFVDAVTDIFLQRRLVGLTAAELLPVLRQRGFKLTDRTLARQMARNDIRAKVKLIDGTRRHYYLAQQVYEAAVHHQVLAEVPG